MGQLLGEHAAKRHAEHVHALVAEPVKRVLNHPGEPPHAQRLPQAADWPVPGASKLIV